MTKTCRICGAIINGSWYNLHLDWHKTLTVSVGVEGKICGTAPPEIPEEFQHKTRIPIPFPENAVDFMTPRASIEGDVGTWSHCGNRAAHWEHTHDVSMTGEYIPDVQCNGTR